MIILHFDKVNSKFKTNRHYGYEAVKAFKLKNEVLKYFVLSQINSWHKFIALKINEAVRKRIGKVTDIRYVVLDE